MNKLKKIIVFIFIITSILIVGILLILKNNKNTNENIIVDDVGEPEGIEEDEDNTNIVKELDNRMDYFIVKNVFENTLNYINYLDYDLSQGKLEFTSESEEKQFLNKYKNEGINMLKNIMPKEYINSFGMDDNNIYNNLVKYANKDIMISNVYDTNSNSNIKIFFVYATVLDTNEDFNIIVLIDYNNSTFNILLENYIEKEKIDKSKIIGMSFKLGLNEITQKDSIESNEYNTYEIPSVSNEMYAQELIENYKHYLLDFTQKAYDLLDDEYKAKKFNGIDKFKNYINNKNSNIEDMELSKYKVNTYNDYTEYICIDQFGNYIIFKETAVMNYSVILDTYTVDLPEVVERYNNSDEKEKVGMNITKIFDALNDKDYEYVYNKLNDTFKKNNFDQLTLFENFVNDNLFNKNKVESGDFSEEGSAYVYKLNIKNPDDDSEGTKKMTVVMKLLEGTDFVMSFSLE